MKKIFIVAMLLTASVAFAQTESGGFLVGASSELSFSSTSIDGVDDNLTTFSLNTQAGYFVIDNLAVGEGG